MSLDGAPDSDDADTAKFKNRSSVLNLKIHLRPTLTLRNDIESRLALLRPRTRRDPANPA